MADGLGLLNPVRVTAEGYIAVNENYLGHIPQWDDADELECTHCGGKDFWWLRGDGAECGHCGGKDFWWLRDGQLIDDAEGNMEQTENLGSHPFTRLGDQEYLEPVQDDDLWFEDDAADRLLEQLLKLWIYCPT
jgi:hypothetical protein